jgi:Domain of unknown function (DUF6438)
MVAATILLLSIAACAPRNSGGTTSERTEVAGGPVLTLERTACFGACPVYRLSVTPDGKISYEGKAHVRHLGPASASIPSERLDSLLSELELAGYFSFAARYAPADPACGRYSTDSPSAITSIRVGERVKRIEHDYGCSNAPGALVLLERRIDEVLDSGQWTGR